MKRSGVAELAVRTVLEHEAQLLAELPFTQAERREVRRLCKAEVDAIDDYCAGKPINLATTRLHVSKRRIRLTRRARARALEEVTAGGTE